MSGEAENRLLVIDDTPSIHDDFRKILAQGPGFGQEAVESLAALVFGGSRPPLPLSTTHYQMDSAYQGEEGMAKVAQAVREGRPYALAFVDMRMPPGWDGLETIEQLWRVDPSLQIVICSAYSDHSWATICQKLGANDNLLILKKPFDHTEVLQIAHTLVSKWRLSRRVAEQISNLDQLVSRRTTELRQAEDRFVQAFDASPLAQAILALDSGEILEVNAAFERLLGQTRAVLRGLSPTTVGRGLEPERFHDLLRKLRAGQAVDDHAFLFVSDEGTPREMRASARPVTIHGRACSVWVVSDVTERLLLEQQLRQAQRMDAVGQLAAGVAHDFNNLLTAILNYCSLALDDAAVGGFTQESFQQIQKAAERATALTRQLLVVSRQQVTDVRLLSLAQTVTALRDMLQRLLPETIELRWSAEPDTPLIRADEANVEQIVLNLVVNARDALPRGGRIEVSVRAIQITAAELRRHPQAREGRFACLTVTDNGVGIPQEIMPRIFDPFFTTKEVGKGTGLGLATVYSIAKQHQGWIEVASAEGSGTRFELYFPAAEEEAATPTTGQAMTALPETKEARILYVEDDLIVQKVTEALLRRHHRQVTVASNGPSALRLWRENHGQFDLLFTDMVMPGGLTGSELAQKLQAEDPHLRVLFTSGYSAELVADYEGIAGPHPLLQKPYSQEDLLRCLAEALATPV